MPAGGKPTVRSRRLGTALRLHRQAAKMDQAQAAEAIASSTAKISRMESGHVSCRVIDVRLLMGAYGVTDREKVARLEELAKRSNRRGWWLEHAAHLRTDYLDHISLEDDASYIREWQPVMFPGLLQTSAYAEAAIAAGLGYVAPERVEKLIKVREGRQGKIAEGGASYTAIVWEPVITQPLVDAEIHREQLTRTLEVGKRRNVTIQVLPFTAGVKAGMTSAFASFSFDSEPTVEAVTLDNLRGTSILEAADDLTAYANAFDQLRSAALAPEASAQLMRGLLRSSKEDTS
ncbi:helix-turn-helix transcriptional regulator [Streptomyces sp. 35G-GA-8]|uniref:helix-turn-helix domain-containing protein n=1 Tax=Streptomyces sp. 35G-GA-8 TaxID=2939434 RepID=UPI00201F235E|nr:helix-turn-helix transcriptional regulator [Streptomyces sp. 35G-GA-8]MCL7380745.1 helix-turn-helix domain-containing protein [Streptomyces sp. 35G-GA-8]